MQKLDFFQLPRNTKIVLLYMHLKAAHTVKLLQIYNNSSYLPSKLKNN